MSKPEGVRRGKPDDFSIQRQKMVARQLADRGIRDSSVLAAMSRVPRERFVPVESRLDSYFDGALEIDCGQTISQPFVVAAMTQALELRGHERVLEVGTGSGYQTAILADIVAQVVTIERHAALTRAASALLGELGYSNITYLIGDGSQGDAGRGPYQGIVVTAAAPFCPPALLEQLAEGGILVGPFGTEDGQQLQVLKKQGGRITAEVLFAVRFVPLICGPEGSQS